MSPRFFGLVLLVGLAGSGPVAAQQFVNLPLGSWANDITPDGEVVVGTYDYSKGFIWRWRVDAAPTVIAGGNFSGVSDDGTAACGNILDPGGSGETVAARWTAATGWQSLGYVPGTPTTCGGGMSSAHDISGDGTTVVGLAWGSGCDGVGFIWTEAGGMQLLQSLANGHNRCSAISNDGSVLGGFAQGTFSRTPAYWSPDTSGAVLDSNFQGEVVGFNQDGSKSVGTKWFSGNNYSAFVRDRQSGVFTNLGQLQSSWAATASDLSEDASVIVGYDYFSLSRKAWVWTASDGIKSLKDRMTALGVTGVPANVLVCRAVSADGTVIVGGAEAGGGGPFGIAGFIAEIPGKPTQWTNLAGGLAGTAGIPRLAGTGALTPASPTSVVLTQGKPGAGAVLVVGLTAANVPFKQGVLVPHPNHLLGVPALSPAGAVALNFKWPGGVPTGFALYWQFLVSDSAGPAGFAISNALKSLTP